MYKEEVEAVRCKAEEEGNNCKVEEKRNKCKAAGDNNNSATITAAEMDTQIKTTVKGIRTNTNNRKGFFSKL